MKHDQVLSAGEPFRISWAAVLGGLVAAFGVWSLLYVVGLALGFSSLDFDRPNLARALGIGGGVWVIFSGFAAMFVGGVVTARSAGYVDRGNGALHGLVLWGTAAAAAALATTVVVGVALPNAATTTEIAASVNISPNDVLEPVNAKLQQQGKPPLEPRQVAVIARDALRDSVAKGGFDKDAFVAAVARNTNFSQNEVRDMLADTLAQAEAQAAQFKERTKQAAEAAATATARALWALFTLMAVSLAGSVLGASTGVSRQQRAHSSPWAETVITPHEEVFR